VAGRIIPMKNSDDTIGNRTRNVPVCSAELHRVPPCLNNAVHIIYLGTRRRRVIAFKFRPIYPRGGEVPGTNFIRSLRGAGGSRDNAEEKNITGLHVKSMCGCWPYH
jgi:hypothetical protein